jgi:hypothetical protein
MNRHPSKERWARITRLLGEAMLRMDPMVYCQYLAATSVENHDGSLTDVAVLGRQHESTLASAHGRSGVTEERRAFA